MAVTVCVMSEVVFSPQASQCCVGLVQTALDLKDKAVELRDILLRDGVITDEDSYYTVLENVPLKSAILKYLSAGLPKEANMSRYGAKVVSDFDLYHNMQTDSRFNDMLDSIKFDYNDKKKWLQLKKNRNNIRQWLIRLRTNVILDIDLPETPDRDELNRQKKAARPVIKSWKKLTARLLGSREIAAISLLV